MVLCKHFLTTLFAKLEVHNNANLTAAEQDADDDTSQDAADLVSQDEKSKSSKSEKIGKENYWFKFSLLDSACYEMSWSILFL